ncbi:integrase core domain-containing protein [Pseudonocardia sulfidoxydans]|uniref:integrase core domain-containing protein n=1 Tax=Pseudonocardia sulfidoxydans TaxID=54011 RepID=UPI003617ED52
MRLWPSFMAVKQAMMYYMDAALMAGAPITNVAQWCRDNDINVRTFYRHRARIAAEGKWVERSRRPHTSPTATPQPVVAEILRLRQVLAPDNGADSIRAELIELATGQDWAGQDLTVPSRATINRILDRHGLLAKNPAKKPRSAHRRFGFARPRDCYQIDGTEHRLADGSVVVAIDIIDDATRVWVASYVCAGETTDAALAAMAAAEKEWGLPGLVLADNATAFAHPHRFLDKTLTSRFSRALAAKGTRVIHPSPYHPQTCGKCERLHGTAKKLLAHHYPDPPADLAELQARLDTVREHYNNTRRHSAIGRIPPRQAWERIRDHGGPADLPRQTDATVHVLTVMANGTVTVGRHIVSVGRGRAGATVTLLRAGDHLTAYAAEGEPLGQLLLDPDGPRYQGAFRAPAA